MASDVAIFPNNITRKICLVDFNVFVRIFVEKFKSISEQGLHICVLLMESTEESLGPGYTVVVFILVFCHFFFHFIGLIKLASHQELGTFLKERHHFSVVKSNLKVGYSILKGNVVSLNSFKILSTLFTITIALVILADPLL